MQDKILALNNWFTRNKYSKESEKLLSLLKTADAAGNIVGTFGYPRVIAEILWEKFGKNSFVIARWLKEYNTRASKYEGPDDWLDRIGDEQGGFTEDGSITKLLKLYNSATNAETYLRVADDLDIWIPDEPLTDKDLEKLRMMIRKEIEIDISKNMFFYYSLFNKILNGEVTDLRPYKNLTPEEALARYEEKNLFLDQEPIRTYDNGWRWIDAGNKCSLLGKAMSNCGSAGIMSSDPDRTMLSLFDEHNKPHVLVTYSPNQKRISGDVGRGHSPVKDIYHQYVIDLAEFLGAEFDSQKSPSKELGIKWDLRSYLKDVKMEYKDTFNSIYRIVLTDGSSYYTDTFKFLSEQDMALTQSHLESLSDEERQEHGVVGVNNLTAVFNNRNTDYLSRELGIKYISRYLLLKDLQE
jgi:hypothetical protein